MRPNGARAPPSKPTNRLTPSVELLVRRSQTLAQEPDFPNLQVGLENLPGLLLDHVTVRAHVSFWSNWWQSSPPLGLKVSDSGYCDNRHSNADK